MARRQSLTRALLPDDIIADARTRTADAWRNLTGRAERLEFETLKAEEKAFVFRLVAAGPGGEDIVAKRSRRDALKFEQRIYEDFLSVIPVPAPTYYGFVRESGTEFSVLFLQDAGGIPYSSGVHEHRRLSATWLAKLHTASAEHARRDPLLFEDLPDRGVGYFREHMERGHAQLLAALNNPALSPEDLTAVEAMAGLFARLERNWNTVTQIASRFPQTLVHGDMVGRNLRVTSDSLRPLMPFDWEHAGAGSPAPDLAQAPDESTSFSASCDLEGYYDGIRERWPQVTMDDVRELAHLGTVFRLLSSIAWSTHRLSTAWPAKDVRRLWEYRPRFDSATAAIGASA